MVGQVQLRPEPHPAIGTAAATANTTTTGMVLMNESNPTRTSKLMGPMIP
jgi:hypothetical protein